MADECGDAVGDSPSLLMEADNRRDWKRKRTCGLRPSETYSQSPRVSSSMEHLGDRKQEGERRDRGTTLEILKACMWLGSGTMVIGEDNLIFGMGRDPLRGPKPPRPQLTLAPVGWTPSLLPVGRDDTCCILF